MFGRRERTIERLLVVEDEPLVAFDTEHLLTEDGYEVVATVDRVADAIAVLGGGAALDLILVDVNLTDGSGIDVARAAHERGTPVLFVTSACPVEAHSLAIGCLAKPYAQRDLLNAIVAVERAIAGKPPRRLPGGFRLFAAAPSPRT